MEIADLILIILSIVVLIACKWLKVKDSIKYNIRFACCLVIMTLLTSELTDNYEIPWWVGIGISVIIIAIIAFLTRSNAQNNT